MDTLETPQVPNGQSANVPSSDPPPAADNTAAASSFPDPISSPLVFLHHLRSLPIGDLSLAWQHCLSRPVRVTSSERYAVSEVNAWMDRMDTLTVSFSIASPIY